MQSPLRRERDDLLLLATVALLVVAIWCVVLRWDARALLGSHDLGLYVTLVDRLRAAAGDWRAAWYSPEVMGGGTLVGVYGSAPVFALGARLGLSSFDVVNVAVLGTQALFGFLGVRASADVARTWRADASEEAGPLALLAFAPFFAFAPVLAWRVGHGHLNLAWGMLAFLATLALVAAAKARRTTVTLSVAAFVAFAHAFTSHAFQVLLYAAVLGAPIVLVMAASGPSRSLRTFARALAPLAVVLALALLVSAWKLAAMIGYASSSDSLRSSGDVAVYAYLKGEARDWLSSLAWSHELLPSARPKIVWHEIHLAFGPPLLLLLAAPLRRAWPLVVSVVGSLVAAILFASGVPPISSLLVRVPTLAAFRVPERAVLPASMALLVVAGASLLIHARRARSPLAGLAPFALLGLAFAPAKAAELVAWALVVLVVASARVRFPSRPLAIVRASAPFAIGALGVGAFGIKLPTFVPRADVDARDALATQIRAIAPELGAPLARATIGISMRPFGVNTGVFLGVSTLDGYGYPTRRFAALATTLGAEPGAAATVYAFQPGTDAFRVLGQLYDLQDIIYLRATQVSRVRPGATAGAAWFSERVEWVDSFDALGARLRTAPGGTAPLARETMLLVASDPRRPASIEIDPGCGRASFEALDVSRADVRIDARVHVEGRCPVTFATNYLETIRAEIVRRDGGRAPVDVFPAYGALAATMVPADAVGITVRTDHAR